MATAMAMADAADIPVRQIVLYKSGVGYFERGGELRAGESARLDFKAAEMNDVLKSLTISDKGGKISGLRYDSSEPLENKLAEFPFHVGGAQSMSAFLDQIKGARVELKYGNETVAGAIVSGRTVAGTDKTPEREQAVILMDSGELRAFDLAAASSIRFPDAKLQAQLRDYLAAVNQSRSKDKRSIYVDSTDSGARQLSASYMVPMPVWKSSYRLIFGAAGEPTLEGWAIVDNSTGEDWTNVRLSVVSGRPVSFISRLYEPRFLTRPTVDLPEDRAQGPVLYEGAISAPPPAAPMMAALPAVRAKKANSDQAFSQTGRMERFAEPEQMAESTIAASAQGRDLGDLFEYSFATPVTVKKSESAMLPFLQQKLGARKLLIYSETYGANPMSAAELSNSTGKTLDGGPLTVFDAGNYSGEALMETLRPGDKRLISYAVDLGTRIATKFDSGRDLVREIRAARGVITTKLAVQETKTFTIKNVDAKPKTVILEQPLRDGYKLLSAKATETTSRAYRFEVKVGPNATEAFPVKEERVYDQSVAVTNMTPGSLAAFLQNKAISEAGRKQLEQIADLKRQIAAFDAQIREEESHFNELANDQNRIRQNLNSLNNVNGQQEQVQKYARQLAEIDGAIAASRDKSSDAKKKKTGVETALNRAVENLAF